MLGLGSAVLVAVLTIFVLLLVLTSVSLLFDFVVCHGVGSTDATSCVIGDVFCGGFVDLDVALGVLIWAAIIAPEVLCRSFGMSTGVGHGVLATGEQR